MAAPGLGTAVTPVGANGVKGGKGYVTFVPLPSWPLTLLPQHEYIPMVSNAHVLSSPATNCVAPLSRTASGTVDDRNVPVPSAPYWFQPQHLTVLERSSAQLCP